ncbi:MAG: glycosyltransferase [Lachnospiraceae bacterium]|nr:glycosyltransferase [Lachnospiraceae bacterium]
MSEQLLFSIVTPSFNSEKTIKKTIESVLNQSYPNYEYIIVDGGSKDNTVKIIESYIPLFGGKLRYVSEKDKGIYDAMNKGIDMARGEIVGIINSDDYYENDCLETVVKHYDPNKKYQVIYGALRFLDQAGEEIEISISKHNNHKKMIFHPSMFVSRNIYLDLFMYNTKFKYSSDLEFRYKLAKNSEIQYVPVYQVLSNYMIGGASYSTEAKIETNEIEYKYHYISRMRFWINAIKFRIKYILIKLHIYDEG